MKQDDQGYRVLSTAGKKCKQGWLCFVVIVISLDSAETEAPHCA
jgi:hypothetical protein